MRSNEWDQNLIPMKSYIADEAIQLILTYLQVDDLLGKKLVCRRWRTIVIDVMNGKKKKFSNNLPNCK